MNVEPSRPASPSSRTRRTVRHLAVAGMLTIPIAACSSDGSATPTAVGTAAPTVPTTASARIETPSSTDAPARPAVTQPPNSIDRRFDSTDPEVATPLESVRGSQTSGADVELFRVTADVPMYWRVAALPEFDGRTWGRHCCSMSRTRAVPSSAVTQFEVIEFVEMTTMTMSASPIPSSKILWLRLSPSSKAHSAYQVSTPLSGAAWPDRARSGLDRASSG
jgi:hypothetical protein